MPTPLAIHPGEILLEKFLRPHGIAPTAFATRIGVPANRVAAIVNGTRAVSPETALLLAEAFGTSPEFWLNLQAHYDLTLARASLSPQRVRRARALRKELATA